MLAGRTSRRSTLNDKGSFMSLSDLNVSESVSGSAVMTSNGTRRVSVSIGYIFRTTMQLRKNRLSCLGDIVRRVIQ